MNSRITDNTNITKLSFAFLLMVIFSFANAQDSIFQCNFDDNYTNAWTTESHDLNNVRDRNSFKVSFPNGGYGYNDLPYVMDFVGYPDPTVDHTPNNNSNNVAGQGLRESRTKPGRSGHYNDMEEWFISPAIICTDYKNVSLSFWRWANFEPYYDEAYVQISTDKINWTDLGQPTYPRDLEWTEVNIDISQYADGQASVYIRWGSISDYSVFYSGWNIDDVVITGTYTGDIIWEGDVSQNWNVLENWSGNRMPTAETNVTIPAYSQINVENSGICKNLILEPGALLQITGDLTVANDITIISDGIISGALIDNENLTVYGTSEFIQIIHGGKWHYISSPTDGAYAKDIQGKVFDWIEPNTGDDWTNGWKRIYPEAFEAGNGYDVYCFLDDTVHFTGAFNTGQVSIDVTYTEGLEIEDHKGWNLIGNPYPSPLNWDAVEKSNLNDAIYLWDEATQTFTAYINGTGINGGEKYIAPGQGFFVKSLPGGGNITMDNSDRVLIADVKFKSGQQVPTLQVSISDSKYTDQTAIRFTDYASQDFDGNMDALKKFSLNDLVPQIYTAGNELEYAINSLPSLTQSIDLNIKTIVPGTKSISFEGITSLNGESLVLEDLKTGNLVDLRSTSQYEFITERNEPVNRFRLHTGYPLNVDIATTANVSCYGLNDGAAELEIIGGFYPLTFSWSNNASTQNISNLKAGEYSVTVTDANGTTISKSIIINEPKKMNIELTDIQAESYTGANDGSATIETANLTPTYTLEWSDGSNGNQITNLTAGEYHVKVTDENGCKQIESFKITSIEAPLNIEENNSETKIFADNNFIHIYFSSTIDNAEINIFDASGRLMQTTTTENDNSISIPVNNVNTSAFYIVQVNMDNQQISEKVLVK